MDLVKKSGNSEIALLRQQTKWKITGIAIGKLSLSLTYDTTLPWSQPQSCLMLISSDVFRTYLQKKKQLECLTLATVHFCKACVNVENIKAGALANLVISEPFT